MGATAEDTERERVQKRAAMIGLAKFLAGLVLSGAVLFLSAGRLDWPMGWIYLGYALANTLAVAFLAPTDLQAERSSFHEGTKGWDIPLVLLMARFGPLAILVVAGLDRRFGWSAGISVSAQLLAFLVMIVASCLTLWAMVVNRFFSGVVRIQTDRGHTVVDRGPYAWVRHPGYVGALLHTLALPFLLSSWWGLIPAGLTAAVIVLRTALEDRTLRQELAGYAEYAARVRYRLFPGVW